MHSTLRPLAIGLGLLLASACAKTHADAAKPPEPATGTSGTQRPTSVSGIYVSPEIQKACDVTMAKAFFEFDSAAIDDTDDGSLKLVLLPTGQFSGNTITSWLIALHDANVFGLPYRIFVSALGLVIAMLSVTGVYIWWKKRKARSLSWQRRNSPSAAVSADA